MKHFCSLFALAFISFQTSVAQHLTIEFPLNIPAARTDSWEQSLDLSAYVFQDFAAVSIVFEGEKMDANAVSCAYKTGDGWQEIPHFGEETRLGRFVSELLFIPAESARQLTFRFKFNPEIDPRDVQGRLRIFSPTGKIDAVAQPAVQEAPSTDCPCPQPGFVARSSWGAAFGLSGDIYKPPAVYTTVTHLIVHHSAGSNTSNNWPGVVAAIFDYHINTNGWADIGYNWLVAPNGQLFEGRGGGDNVRGSHMCGYNNNTMGVCVLGNYGNVSPPASGLETLKKLLSWKCCKEAIEPEGSGPIASYAGFMKNISGHRDGCAPNYTECPGALLQAELGALRLDVSQYMENECTVFLGAAAIANPAALTLSPNPASETLLLQFSASKDRGQIRVFDALGRLVGIQAVERGVSAFNMPVSHLKPGLYWVIYEFDSATAFAKFSKF